MSFLDSLKKRYRIEGVNEFGIHTDRRRYHVVCLECGEMLHEATTGVEGRCREHDEVECSPDEDELISLRIAARTFGVAQSWLIREHMEGRIPGLLAGSTVVFSMKALQASLLQRARTR